MARDVILAPQAGFCFGVRKAVEQAKSAAELARQQGMSIYSLGRLVHNRQVVEQLAQLGMKVITDINQVKGPGYLLISAHGCAPSIIAEAGQRGLSLIDTTCPMVRKVQDLARKLCQQEMMVILVGDEVHPEVKGVVEGAGCQVWVVNKVASLKSLEFKEQVGVIAQTTQSTGLFQEIVAYLENRVTNLVVHNTICSATRDRQNATVELAKRVEVMLVVGDRASGNTKRLYELSRATGTPTHWIQDAAELDTDWLVGRTKVGLTAGASTPDNIIVEVKQKILKAA